MRVQINKPVTLGESTYGKGQHTIPKGEASGWFFDALVADGDAVVLLDDDAPKDDAPKDDAPKDDAPKDDAPNGKKAKGKKAKD